MATIYWTAEPQMQVCSYTLAQPRCSEAAMQTAASLNFNSMLAKGKLCSRSVPPWICTPANAYGMGCYITVCDNHWSAMARIRAESHVRCSKDAGGCDDATLFSTIVCQFALVESGHHAKPSTAVWGVW